MKQLKALLSLVVATLTGATFVACNGYDSPLEGKNIDNLTFEAEQSSQVIEMGKELSNCYSESTEAWCITSVSGTVVRVAVLDNQTYEERTATVNVIDNEDGSRISFSVTQKQNDAIILEKTVYEVEQEGGIVELKLKKNLKDMEIQLSADWMKETTRATRALEDYSVEVYVSPNDSGDPREGSIIVKDANGSYSKEITIKQAFHPYIIVTPKDILAGKDGGEFEVTVDANTSYSVETTATGSWVTAESKTDLGNNKSRVTLKVAPLTGTEDRECKVFFNHYLDGRVTVVNTVNVYQSNK